MQSFLRHPVSEIRKPNSYADGRHVHILEEYHWLTLLSSNPRLGWPLTDFHPQWTFLVRATCILISLLNGER